MPTDTQPRLTRAIFVLTWPKGVPRRGETGARRLGPFTSRLAAETAADLLNSKHPPRHAIITEQEYRPQ